MYWTENERCIFCDKGGKLLVCNDDGCPISIHKDCMDCKAWSSGIGNFYCPYCLYRRLTIETCQLRDKAILAKKALSNFLGEKHRDGNYHEPKPEMANEKEQILSRNGNKCRIMVVYKARSDPIVGRGVDCVLCKEHWMNGDELESGVCEGVRVEVRVENAECKNGGVAEVHSTFKEKAPPSKNVVISSCIEKETARKKRKRSEALNRTRKGRTEQCVMEHGAKTFESVPLGPQFESKPNRPKVFDRYAKPPLVKGKRRVRWSDEEEDMLKEGVEKYSATAHKNLPWKKVLEFGHHVFDASRTPADLKDKWRNMAK